MTCSAAWCIQTNHYPAALSVWSWEAIDAPHGSCCTPHGLGKEILSHILNHIKQWVYFCCHLPHRYFLRWTKLPHTSLLLGTVADLTEGKSDFSMDVPSSQYRSRNCSATVTSACRWMCKRTSYPACSRMRSAAWILLWWSMKKMERTMYERKRSGSCQRHVSS